MPHRHKLGTVQPFSALRDALRQRPYDLNSLRADLLAGVSVAIVAIPLAMALAIAVGVPPQYGLYSAIIGGLVAALAGGSRYSISGPTAAFVVVLAPIASTYGMAGLATAGLLAGGLLVAMGLARMGRLVEYVPEPVTVGFTSGIALVIAVLQLNDLLGLGVRGLPEHFLGKVASLLAALPQASWAPLLVAAITLLVKIFWPQKRLLLPGYAPAIFAGTMAALLLAWSGHPVDTIGTRFAYVIDGMSGHGIPQAMPRLALPWLLPGPEGGSFILDMATFRALLPAAVTIAMLGAIESLLCAVVLDRSTRTRHHSNGELVGAGMANMVAPFFGGIPVTAAIARSVVNVKAGARTPLAAAFHALFVLLGVLLMAPLLAFVPMAAMAAVLLVVAWNMSEAHTALLLMRRASRADRLVLLVCFSLTVIFDMVIAIGVGMVLAAFLFMRDIARFTQVRELDSDPVLATTPLPEGWRVVSINGAMFFAAAERILAQLLEQSPDGSGLIIDGDGITLLDAGGVSALERFEEECEERRIRVLLSGLTAQPARAARDARIGQKPGVLSLLPHLSIAVETARNEETTAGKRS
ncbi:MAG: C4-dicarboxylic acid transporter DauA [Candidatus Delongbacteria bacterium]|nr:C4-dicarboxylic acid transporter DauA [Candidatus Delongbacteria bacterium]